MRAAPCRANDVERFGMSTISTSQGSWSFAGDRQHPDHALAAGFLVEERAADARLTSRTGDVTESTSRGNVRDWVRTYPR